MAEDKKKFEERLKAFYEACKAEDWDEAIELSEALRAEFPNSFDADELCTKNLASAYNNRGSSYAEQKQYERSIKDYNQAIEIRPDYAEAYNNRGNSYADLEQYERAIKDFDKAIKINSEYAEAYNNRGNSYLGLEEYEQAIADYDKAIELNPENVGAYHNQALTIGRQEAEKATQTIKESYEERLSSITTPDEIDKFYEGEISSSTDRLEGLRAKGETASKDLWLKVSLAWLAPFLVYLGLIFCEKIPVENSLFQLLSVSLSALFLSTPFFWHLKRLNHDIRVERHALEDFRRKWLLFRLLGAQPDEELRRQYSVQIIEHLDKRGTPEVLNKLYHPKQAHAQDSQRDSREGLLTSLPRINPAD